MSQLQWRDDADVYKPRNHALSSFLKSRDQLIDNRQRRSSLTQQTDHPSEMLIFVDQSAENQLINHLSVDPNNETGGALVGNAYYCSAEQKHYTEIVGSIPAPYTIGNRVHFRFTPECWQEILRTQKEHYPQTTIVGWYHSHPGHGIFLSGTDLNTQRLSFGKIWQIAAVYDPIRREIGYFYGEQGKRLSPVYLSSSISLPNESPPNASPINEETSEPLVTRRVELPRLPVPKPEVNRNIEEDASNPETANFTQDTNSRQDPENSGWSVLSILDVLNNLLERLSRFILGGGR
ncbi:Mov34/MPN/PAD-1 family protein [Limnothrix sp. FACHB-708]|uniref:Mov34/MPN/PAD-1 family protein n=1 Tax=unclassified Limnothrix TaxID=2632864 RepID=UPI001686C8C8|nr:MULTISPECIES: Mov34/MPN/PAD-1 family protein [unclassified Limnothrix]MBD2552005.1 Mov34/MPN/PAD-1 family protein [Limnothrix sp. FACHB-708]MBD2589685.1 Mov34/MPN/PAD-1 family protein [Limnothrix sp. FACHB-406]